MAAVSDVPDMTKQEMAIGARHRFYLFYLKVALRLQKATAKFLKGRLL
jgi:hypothetical protein